MAQINLLPWREERREEQKREFLAIAGLFAVVAAGVVFLWYSVMSAAIDTQNDRNGYLQKRINELNAQVREINDMKKQKKQLIARMEVIQSLQGNRPEIVHIFDELVRTLPDGVFYNSIVRKGGTISLKGTAESNNRVSSLMRQLDASEWFSDPNLRMVNANRSFGDQANDFEMTVKLTSPNKKEDTAENKRRARKK